MRRKPCEGRVALLSGRPQEVSGNRHRRWMTIPALARDRTRLTGHLIGTTLPLPLLGESTLSGVRRDTASGLTCLPDCNVTAATGRDTPPCRLP